MSALLAVMRREIQAYFVSPIAYVFMTVFLVIAGAGFFYGLQRYLLIDAAFAEQHNVTLRTYVVAGRFGIGNWVRLAIILSLPGLSMRLLSEERKSGTVELLFTSPITTAQIVLGKYLGTVLVYALILVLTVPLVAVMAWKGAPELAAIGAAYLGMFLHGALVLAVGLFASSLTENQFVALVVSYVLLVPLLMVQMVVGFAGPVLDAVLAAVSIGVGLHDMFSGLVDTHHVVLFVSLIFTFLFLSTRVLESPRWR